MMNLKIYCISILSAYTSTLYSSSNEEVVSSDIMNAMMQKIYTQIIAAKIEVNNVARDNELLFNISSTAPTTPFIVNADVDEDLLSGDPEAMVYVSTNNQNSWYNESAFPLGGLGYENTWEASISTDGSSGIVWYIEGQVNPEALGYDYERMYVTQTPKYDGFLWDPSDNYFQRLTDEGSGDAPADQDIYDLQGTYKDDRIYFKLSLSGGCCDPGGFFGPWYLYGIGFFNPDSESDVVYAIGYGDGGLLAGDQLYPGLLRIEGDLESGEISGFEYITDNINYVISGDDLYVSCLMSYFLNDADFGPWPNSFGNALGVIAVTVEASVDLSTEIHDQTNPGMDIMETQFQDENYPLVLASPAYDDNTKTLSITYSDADGNLPWYKSAQICNTPENGGVCFLALDMIPDSHVYEEEVQFSASFVDEGVDLSGDYEAHFWFSDSYIEEYPEAQVVFPIYVGSGNDCAPIGDVNEDGVTNILDVVVTVNIILCPECPGGENPCADVNDDGEFNILDIVLIVNIILSAS